MTFSTTLFNSKHLNAINFFITIIMDFITTTTIINFNNKAFATFATITIIIAVKSNM